MIDFKNEGLTQKAMARLANVSSSAVSRYLSANKVVHISEGNQRNLKYSIDDARKTIKSLSGNSDKIIRKRQAFYNFKGGTGKTSVCFQVSAHMALIGYKILAIDADPQAHLSLSFGIMNESSFTLYDVIAGNKSVDSVIKNVYEGLDIIPSNLSLTRLETELSNIPRREERISIELESLQDVYDFIFIDTNPTISILNRNIINYSDVLNIVCETQPYSLNGLKLLMEDLTKFFHHMGIKSKYIHIIPNKYEDRSTNSGEAMAILKEHYSKYTKEDFAIRKSEDIITSSKLSKPLAFFAKKNSNALEDITDLVMHILKFSTPEQQEMKIK